MSFEIYNMAIIKEYKKTITDPSEPIKNETGGIRVIRGEF